MPDLPNFLPAKEVAQILNVNEVTLRRWRSNGSGPPFYKIGEGHTGRIIYAETEVRKWLQDQRVNGSTR